MKTLAPTPLDRTVSGAVDYSDGAESHRMICGYTPLAAERSPSLRINRDEDPNKDHRRGPGLNSSSSVPVPRSPTAGLKRTAAPHHPWNTLITHTKAITLI